MTGYRVTAPYITFPSPSRAAAVAALLPVTDSWPPADYDLDPITSLGVDAVLPADVPPASVTFLLGHNLIAAIP